MRIAFALAVLAVLAPTVASADKISDAKEHYKQGTAAYALGKYAEAATHYEAAFELSPDPALLYNAAQAHRIAGNKQRALTLYQSYLRMYGPQAQNRDDVERHIDELKRAIDVDERAKNSPPTGPTTTSPSDGNALAAAPARKRPLAKNPWLWVGVGAGVAVVAGVAIGLGVAFGKSDPQASIGTVVY
jgi:tetratricopeptide (TPR) repeat protein